MASEKRIGTRDDYRWFTAITTRWMDNDVYGHVNNVQYYSFFDTAVADFLLECGALDIARSPAIGLVVETQCRYFAPITYPDRVTVGLRCARIGTSSVRYEIGVFRNDEHRASAEGHFVHVYVRRDAQDRTTPMPARLREALQALLVAPAG